MASAEEKVIVGDVGTVLKVRAFEEDEDNTLESVSTLLLKVTKPDGTAVEWTASIDSDDNKLAAYTAVAEDFDQAGTYVGRLYAEWDASNKWHGKNFKFKVIAV
jgi:hypothetical protein